MYYDIHTHKNCDNNNVTAIRSVEAIDSFSPEPGKLYSVGIHPWHADEKLTTLVERCCQLPQVVAIGESGLDRLKGDFDIQTKLFASQIQLSERYSKPMIIHCTRAWNELLQFKKKLKPTSAWIVHGFRKNDVLADALLKAGFVLAFGELFNHDALLLAWQQQRLLAETDVSDKDILTIYSRFADSLNIPLPELQSGVEATFNSIF